MTIPHAVPPCHTPHTPLSPPSLNTKKVDSDSHESARCHWSRGDGDGAAIPPAGGAAGRGRRLLDKCSRPLGPATFMPVERWLTGVHPAPRSCWCAPVHGHGTLHKHTRFPLSCCTTHVARLPPHPRRCLCRCDTQRGTRLAVVGGIGSWDGRAQSGERALISDRMCGAVGMVDVRGCWTRRAVHTWWR
jgi:hypothetical protein